eukprot:PITA_28012
MEEGKLLGHIISKYGIRIDPIRVEVIQQLDFPRNKKEIQSFNGKINFLRRFIPNLVEHLKHMTNMLKKEIEWGLDFISEIHPSSSAQHKWILTATDYSTKWIEAIPTRQATDFLILQFIESNTLSRFGCPQKIITDNAISFNSKRTVDFCAKYHIVLGHSTTYRPQGNVLAESSNKSLVNIIKKVLEVNKKNWHKNLINSLWADRVRNKKSIAMSPFKLVYGTNTIFPSSLVVPVMKILQELDSETNDMQRRINQMIHLLQTREEVL